MTAERLALPFPPLDRDPRATLVEGPANAAARAAFAHWRDWLGGALAFVGPAGVGKSHLAAVWAADVGAVWLDADLAGAPTSGPVVLDRADEVEDARALFSFVEGVRTGALGPVLMTARSRPGLWRADLPDLRSRLRAIAAVEVDRPGEEESRRILQKLFGDRGIEASDGLLEYLVRRIERTPAAAAAAVERLDAEALRRGRSVNRALAQDTFGVDG